MYRIAASNGRLSSAELSIMYNQLGGDACFPLDYEAPDLSCRVCGKQLVLLLQHVSSASNATIHRVVYVFVCNSTHCADSGLVLTVNIPYLWKKDEQTADEKPCAKNITTAHDLLVDSDAQQPSLLDDTGTGADLLSAIKAATLGSGSGANASTSVETKAPASASVSYADEIPFRKIGLPLPVFDLRSSPVTPEAVASLYLDPSEATHGGSNSAATVADAAGDDNIDDNDDADTFVPGTPMELLQRKYPKALVLYAYDKAPLLPREDISRLSGTIDAATYVHECDLFPTVISILQLDKYGTSADNFAEFRSICVWGARTMEPGIHLGTMYIVPEEEFAFNLSN